MKKRYVFAGLGISALLGAGLSILLGFLLPNTIITPYWIILSRSGFQNQGGDIILGNSHLYLQSPLLAQWGTNAWSSQDQVYGLSALEEQGKAGKTIHYEVYSEEERKENDDLNQVGLYCLHSSETEKKPFVINIAGGGFTSVCTMSESLPVAAKFNELGYTSFALTYRLSKNFGTCDSIADLMQDIATGIKYIQDNASTFNVDPDHYLINGFSAGSMAVSLWCNESVGYGKYSLPRPDACGLMYGFDVDSVTKCASYVPTFTRFCQSDPYFALSDYQEMLTHFDEINNPCDGKVVNCLHGFGLGTSTEAEGWVNEEIDFWKKV